MGSVTYRAPRVPLAHRGVPIGVFRYKQGVGYAPLPGVRPVEISYREGPNPAHAVFDYVSGNSYYGMMTIGFEDVLPLNRFGNPYVLNQDENIVVAGMTPTGAIRFLFHGLVQSPEVRFNDREQSLTFQAQGIESTLWHEPLRTTCYRDAGDPTNPTKNVWTNNDIRFNPMIEFAPTPNKVRSDWEIPTPSGRKFAAFFDHLLQSKKTTVIVGGEKQEKTISDWWSLFDAVNWILTVGNYDQTYVRNQDYDYLKLVLSVIVPKEDNYFDIDDPETYTIKPIIIPDTDITGELMPDALDSLLEPNGYKFSFRLTDNGKGEPLTYIDIYKANLGRWNGFKDIYLQDWGQLLDPSSSNVNSAQLCYDTSRIVNEIAVETSNVRVEAGFLLAPMFNINGGSNPRNDMDRSVRELFSKTHKDFELDTYRLFGFDETGDGHVKLTITPGTPVVPGVTPVAGTVDYPTISDVDWDTTVADLTPALGVDKEGNPLFVQRRRPPFRFLWTRGPDGNQIEYRLFISMDFIGARPGVWDGKTGTWYRVGGGFELCDDRIGIRITNENPNAWHIGRMPKDSPGALQAGEVRLIDWLAHTDQKQRRAFSLLLVCTIEADTNLNVRALRRPVSPTKHRICRSVDVRGKLRPGLIAPSSIFHPKRLDASPEPVIVGTELEQARDYAVGKREAFQLGKLAGQVTCDRLINSYDTGDHVRRIVGRFVPLQTNLDGNRREAPVYPRVIGKTWRFGDAHQSTSLILDDTRADGNDL